MDCPNESNIVFQLPIVHFGHSFFCCLLFFFGWLVSLVRFLCILSEMFSQFHFRRVCVRGMAYVSKLLRLSIIDTFTLPGHSWAVWEFFFFHIATLFFGLQSRICREFLNLSVNANIRLVRLLAQYPNSVHTQHTHQTHETKKNWKQSLYATIWWNLHWLCVCSKSNCTGYSLTYSLLYVWTSGLSMIETNVVPKELKRQTHIQSQIRVREKAFDESSFGGIIVHVCVRLSVSHIHDESPQIRMSTVYASHTNAARHRHSLSLSHVQCG